MSDSTQVRREFFLTKDDGSRWLVQYTNHGVRWLPLGSSAEQQDAMAAPGLPPVSPLGGPLGTVSMVAEAAGNLAMAWETRQQRLRQEATHEETRRTQWLSEMIGRWGEVHASGDRLDLMVSEYLAREASNLMEAVVANKRIALPQSMLYDLASIQEVHRSYRRTILAQFAAVETSPEFDVRGSFEKVMPGHRLNLDFIKALAEDPEQEWATRIADKSASAFDTDFAPLFRDPAAFQRRLITSTEVASYEGGVDRQANRFVRMFLVTLPNLIPTDFKPEATEKRDMYRELALFPAEVARARALTAAWLATEEVLSLAHGGRLQVSTQGDRVELTVGRTAALAEITS